MAEAEITATLDTTDVDTGTENISRAFERTNLTIERMQVMQEHMAIATVMHSTTAALSISGLTKEYKDLGIVMELLGQVTNAVFMIERMRYYQRRESYALSGVTIASDTAEAGSKDALTTSLWGNTAAGVASNLWLAPVVAGVIATAVASLYAMQKMETGGDVLTTGPRVLHKGERVLPPGWEGKVGGGGNTLIIQGNVYGVDDLYRHFEEYIRLKQIQHGGIIGG